MSKKPIEHPDKRTLTPAEVARLNKLNRAHHGPGKTRQPQYPDPNDTEAVRRLLEEEEALRDANFDGHKGFDGKGDDCES